MLHMLPHWTHPRMKKGTVIPVWVYSNADEVELFLNGKSLGKDKPGTVWNEMQCEWMVPYQDGKLEAVAYVGGKEINRTSFSTSKHPSKLKTRLQKLEAEDDFTTSYIVTSESLDNNDNLYPYGENKVYYHIEGDVKKISMENGNPIDPTSRTKSDFRALFFGKNRLFLREQPNAEKASLITASILGDKALHTSNTITIDVKEISIFGANKPSTLKIYYTTNGENPETKGTLYKGAFEIADKHHSKKQLQNKMGKPF